MEVSLDPHRSVDVNRQIHVNISQRDQTRQGKATMSENRSFFSREKLAASGGTQTHDILLTMQMLYQLSHRGSSAGQAESLNVMQGQRHLLPVTQGNSNSYL